MSVATRFIRASRPNLFRSIASLALLAVAGSMFLNADSVWMQALSWGCIAFTALVLTRLVVRFVFARDITLTDDGFWLGRVGSGQFTRWRDVKRFGIVDMKRQSFVVYALSGDAASAVHTKKRLHGLPADVSGYFPPSAEITPQNLLVLLNNFHSTKIIRGGSF
ncbi:hypothetical protein [Brevundimonas sp.]|uniref:hypothetical protein n=1 Tax=Brevundimonas sp. TaxID=1871086 RepID=UPI0028A07CB7|nr:hypothetical protein [Brevundimonas sp.]